MRPGEPGAGAAYLRRALTAGTRRFRYRDGVRRLLALPDRTGPALTFPGTAGRGELAYREPDSLLLGSVDWPGGRPAPASADTARGSPQPAGDRESSAHRHVSTVSLEVPGTVPRSPSRRGSTSGASPVETGTPGPASRPAPAAALPEPARPEPGLSEPGRSVAGTPARPAPGDRSDAQANLPSPPGPCTSSGPAPAPARSGVTIGRSAPRPPERLVPSGPSRADAAPSPAVAASPEPEVRVPRPQPAAAGATAEVPRPGTTPGPARYGGEAAPAAAPAAGHPVSGRRLPSTGAARTVDEGPGPPVAALRRLPDARAGENRRAIPGTVPLAGGSRALPERRSSGRAGAPEPARSPAASPPPRLVIVRPPAAPAGPPPAFWDRSHLGRSGLRGRR
jgi:hypothetical protein